LTDATAAPPPPLRWDGDLDRRRAWARRCAVAVFMLGVAIQAAYAAALAFILLFAVARLHTFVLDDPLGDSPLWRFGLAGALGFAAVAFALTLAITMLTARRGAATWLLEGLPVRVGDGDELRHVRNVVAALAIGLGVLEPDVLAIDEPTPNTISGRAGGSTALCVTTGVVALSRAEIEALCAHEMAQLHAPDSKLVSAAFMALIRARNVSRWIEGIGIGLTVLTVAAALEEGVFLPSVFLIGAALAAVSFVAHKLLVQPLFWLREAVVDLADVAAVHLARNPNALASTLTKLAENDRRVAITTERCELLWFEAVETVFEKSDDGKSKHKVNEKRLAEANARSRTELERRAALVTATAQGIRTA